jgi:hypothetical protein
MIHESYLAMRLPSRQAAPIANEQRMATICRRGRYAVARLIQEHGDTKLTELLVTLANCPKARSARMYDRCKAVYEGLVDGLV